MEEKQLMLLLGSLLIGGALAFLGYYLTTGGKRRRLHAEAKLRTEAKNVTDSDEKKSGDQREVSNQATSGGSSKRQAKSKKRREAQQEFSHSWMVGALKGHTAPVLDMDFSANGKYLASCAEDCGMVPTKVELDHSSAFTALPAASTITSPSKAGHRTSASSAPPSPSSSTSSSGLSEEQQEHRTGLSRRQRKNRTRAPRRELRERDDDHDEDHNGPPPQFTPVSAPIIAIPKTAQADKPKLNAGPKKIAAITSNCNEGKKSKSQHIYEISMVNRQHHIIFRPIKLQQVADSTIASLLRSYVLDENQRSEMGYPSKMGIFPGFIMVMNNRTHLSVRRNQQRDQNNKNETEQNNNQQTRSHNLDVNAREFVPAAINHISADPPEVDSGTGTAPSSMDNSDLEQESASDCSDFGEGSLSSSPTLEQTESQRINAIMRGCTRCHRPFYVRREDGEYLTHEKCIYHWGRLRTIQGTATYECCRGKDSARGCTSSRAHVWTGFVPGCNGPFTDFVKTEEPTVHPLDGNYGIYALDCEMCFTKRGLEVGKVAVVAIDGRIVYETTVKPDSKVLDYNTRFSGLRSRDIATAPKTLREVQRDLSSFICSETILIGHALENDLRALRMAHNTCVDTSVAYPHFLGYPYRSSLKVLARQVLGKEIQANEHDPAEDARIAMDLMLRRVQSDFYH